MGFLRRVGHAIAPRLIAQEPSVVHAQRARADLVDSFARAFNAAFTDRTTSKHWGRATNSNINADLAAELPTMRTNARFERQNNGILEGMVATHTLDLIGITGPTLQLLTSNTIWATKAEKIWADWAVMPDYNGQMALVDFLHQDNRLTWDCGEFLNQMVTDPTARGPVKLRLLAIHPRRLDTPPGWYGDRSVTMGVRRAGPGRPLGYFIDDLVEDQWTVGSGMTFTEIPAKDLIHGYTPTEPNQARGIPRLASCLNVVAQLRDYERDVMGAARMAAMLAVLIHTDQAGADPITLDGGSGTDLEPSTMTALPPGYKATQINPAQPGNQYQTFRKEKLLEIGRPACMPLMVVRLDASGHNYSSARIDVQSYERALKAERGALERVLLNRVLREVLTEAIRAGVLPPMPADMVANWVWSPRPHVDPVKETVAQTMQLENQTQSETGACAEHGRDRDTVTAQRRREQTERDVELIERIGRIQDLIDNNPKVKATWAQVMAANGANTAPAAFIEAAAKSIVAETDTDPKSKGKSDES